MKFSFALPTLCLASLLSFSCAKSTSKTTTTSGLIPSNTSVRTSTQTQLRQIWTRNIAQARVFRVSKETVETSTSVILSTLIPSQETTLIQVFATYCPPCLREIPVFNALYSDQHSVIGLSLDASNHDGLVEIMKKHQPRYPVAVMSIDGLNTISRNLDGLPMTLVLNKKRDVTKILYGMADEKLLKAQFETH
jgi:thiol-disulfide isomerase/thioredoxin